MLDVTGPRIISRSPSGPVDLRAETLDSVAVTFDESIDFDVAGTVASGRTT